MNSIKSLITETEKGCATYTEFGEEYCDKCARKIETLKLCQEIQDAKVKELKEEYLKLPTRVLNGKADKDVLDLIDKIFGERLSQAVKE